MTRKDRIVATFCLAVLLFGAFTAGRVYQFQQDLNTIREVLEEP